MPALVPVNHDPFAAPQLTPVEFDPFADPSIFDPKTYAPSAAMPTPFNVDPMADTYAAAGPGVMAGVKGLGEMVATPARYAAPNPYAPGSEEASWYEDQREKMATEWAPQTAMTLAGMGAPAAEAGAAGIFGGKLSKLADHAAMAKAEQMEADGAVPSAIWKETGTARGADKQWRQEIDDSAAELKMQPSELDHKAYLDDVLRHPELYRAYPHLMDVSVEPLPDEIAKSANGDYSAYTNTIRMNKDLSPDQFKSTLLHEMQHAVQNKEGFAPGDNPVNNIPPALGPAQKNFEAVRADTQAEIANTYNTNPVGVEYMKDLIRRDKYGADAAKQNISKPFEEVFRGILNRNPDVARRLGNIVDSEKLIDDAHAAAFKKYRAAMGEVEARNVQERASVPGARTVAPFHSEDIPRFQQRDPRLSGASSASSVPDRFSWVPKPSIDAARQISTEIEEHLGMGKSVGLRVLPDDMANAEGESIPSSYRWEDGTRTDELLSGTSTIGVGSSKLNDVLDALNKLGALGNQPGIFGQGHYLGKRVAVIHGTKSTIGFDPGESIIENAKIGKIWTKTDAGNTGVLPAPSPVAPAASASMPTEKIASAAIRFPNGKVVTGANHVEAWDRADAAAGKRVSIDNVDSGWVTDKGRFVDRNEAARIANARKPELNAEDLPQASGVKLIPVSHDPFAAE